MIFINFLLSSLSRARMNDVFASSGLSYRNPNEKRAINEFINRNEPTTVTGNVSRDYVVFNS